MKKGTESMRLRNNKRFRFHLAKKQAGAAFAQLHPLSRWTPFQMCLKTGRTLSVLFNSEVRGSFSKSLNAFHITLLINDDLTGGLQTKAI